MLVELSIENFGLIDQVLLSFSGGLNVLTGETGAGKSMIIDAVLAVLGGRVANDVVRTGQERAVVEVLFDLSGQPERMGRLREMGIEIDEDNLLLVRREIAAGGRGNIRIGGRPATLAMLRDAADGLVDIHGQHEHQSLLQQEKHLDLLDQYGGSLLMQDGKSLELLDAYGGGDILRLRGEVAALVGELRAVQAELRTLLGDDRDRARRLDLLRFQVDELTEAKLREGEAEELEAERTVLSHSERLKLAAEHGYLRLYEGEGRQQPVVDVISQVRSELQDAVRHDPALGEAVEMLDGALAQVTEAAHFLSDYRERIEHDPGRLANIDARLDQIRSLMRKYGDTEAEMLAYLASVGDELERLQHADELIDRLQAREQELGRRALELAQSLTAARQAAARELGVRVAQELGDLGMPHASLQVAVTPAEPKPGAPSWEPVGPRGWDRVEFLFAPNPGEPAKPLARIVSGGEMSRIMLALKVILARVDGVPTLVFDEVDTGISGRAAQAVAEKLAVIAADRQVLCVTHLAQVAAMADCHLAIAKQVSEQRTVSTVTSLDSEQRADELARMISGASVTALTLDSAREMLRQADGLKEQLRRTA